MNLFKSFLFLFIICALSVLNLVLPAPDFLQSERRPPAAVPALTVRNISSGNFTDRFENAAADGFPFRERFRTIRAATVLGAFMQTDKNGLYFDAYGIGEIKPADEASVGKVTEKINSVASQLTGANIFYSFIPDKSWYSEKKPLGFNADTVKEIFTPEGKFIDLTASLNAESFYRTDLHWNQIQLGEVVSALAEDMKFEEAFAKYEIKTAGEFEGVFAGQMALPAGADELKYYDVPGLHAQYLNAQSTEFEPGPVYDKEKFAGADPPGTDPYDFFLRGAQPLVVIDNGNAANGRELFIFRDSFSSSLTPLIALSYSRVTLIDLRYIDMTSLEKFVTFPRGCDVLFLYSSQVLNKADVLR